MIIKALNLYFYDINNDSDMDNFTFLNDGYLADIDILSFQIYDLKIEEICFMQNCIINKNSSVLFDNPRKFTSRDYL